MGTSSTGVTKPDHESEIYRAFRRLAREGRRKVALRILRDQRILSDLYDHFLIHKALRERGKSVSWQAFRRSSATT